MNGDLRRIAKINVKPLLNIPLNIHRSVNEIRWMLKRGRQIRRYHASSDCKKLNIGCGANRLPGWLNVDFYPAASDVIFLDATQKFPLRDNSFDYIFSEHMIEHIPYDQGLQMLRECYRVLKPGGTIRIDTPDLAKMITLFSVEKSKEQIAYIDWSVNKFAYSDDFRVLHESFVLNRMVREWGHQFIYDAWTLIHAMSSVGFTNGAQFSVGSSNHQALMNIEGHNDISGTEMNTFETLVVEAVK